MVALTRIQFLELAAAGVLVALCVASTPTRADEMIQNLGPVGPHERSTFPAMVTAMSTQWFGTRTTQMPAQRYAFGST